MKKILLTLSCSFIFIYYVQSQTLYGTTPNGGNDAGGTIIKFMASTNDLAVVKSFASPAVQPYYTTLVQANDGKLYGMTRNGGVYGYGVIFSYDTSTGIYTKVKDFDFTNGGSPFGSLIKANDGKLYGMADDVIFSFDPSTSAYTKLYEFNNTDGSGPQGSLLQASDGLLYGMTAQGGSNNGGVIFSFDPSSSTYTKLYDFDDFINGQPLGNLIEASDGKMYGITNGGGTSNAGTIFSFVPSSSAFTTLKNFDVTGGSDPWGSLMQASDGKLYGMTAYGGSSNKGVIFSFDASKGTYIDIEDFDSINGAIPYGNLMQANDGKLYGMTSVGGSNNEGVIFSLDPSTVTYNKLRDFDNNGDNPYGSLMQAGNGKLYGVTHYGGEDHAGIIFSYDPSASAYTKLINFDDGEGINPSGSPIQSKDGKLYGMTTYGGNYGPGVIYSLDPSTSIYTKVYDFDLPSGGVPSGNLVQTSDGKLYGMTTLGGSSNAGAIFSFDPSSATYIKLLDFDETTGGSAGGSPLGSLIRASNGKFYGMLPAIRASSDGDIFSYDPSTSTFTNLMDFKGTTSAGPTGDLVQASDGKLYGMTVLGGKFSDKSGAQYGNGDIFSYDPSSSTYTSLYNFDQVNGGGPFGSLIQAKDGKLYGMTSAGGSSGAGVIFSYDISSSSYTKLKDFDNTDGGNPYGKLLQASDGKLYGMTYQGEVVMLVLFFHSTPFLWII